MIKLREAVNLTRQLSCSASIPLYIQKKALTERIVDCQGCVAFASQLTSLPSIAGNRPKYAHLPDGSMYRLPYAFDYREVEKDKEYAHTVNHHSQSS